MKISMKLVYQYMLIFFNFPPNSSHHHSLQVENCDTNSRLVVDEDDNGKFRPERVDIGPATRPILNCYQQCSIVSCWSPAHPTNMRCSANFETLLGQRRRRWISIGSSRMSRVCCPLVPGKQCHPCMVNTKH